MRQQLPEGHRTSLSQEALQIDFHDFVHMSTWMDDTELAAEFHVAPHEIAALRRNLQRN